MNRKQLLQQRKAGTMREFERFAGDTGSSEVQVRGARCAAQLGGAVLGGGGRPAVTRSAGARRRRQQWGRAVDAAACWHST
jgi:hypothetical protein